MTADDVDPPPEAEPGDRSPLRNRLEALHRNDRPSRERHRPLEDPEIVHKAEIVHKVVHACLGSEQITEEAELQILESLLAGEQPTATGPE